MGVLLKPQNFVTQASCFASQNAPVMVNVYKNNSLVNVLNTFLNFIFWPICTIWDAVVYVFRFQRVVTGASFISRHQKFRILVT